MRWEVVLGGAAAVRLDMADLEAEDPLAGDRLGHVPPELLAALVLDHPGMARGIEPHPHLPPSEGPAHRVGPMVEGDPAHLVHLSSPPPLGQAHSHSLDLPALSLFACIPAGVLLQVGISRKATLAVNRRIEFSLPL